MSFLCIGWNGISAIATALSAVATAIMAWLTYKTIKNSKEQLAVMKEQWDESRKPIVEPSIVIPPYTEIESSLGLQLRNLGNVVAEVVNIKFDDKFINGFENKEIEDQINFICSQQYKIAPNESICLTICDVRKKNGKHILFGETLDDKKYLHLVEFLMSFKVYVACYYVGGKSERTFTYYDRELYRRTVSQELRDISTYLSRIENKLA